MDDREDQRSGSRWEPAAGESTPAAASRAPGTDEATAVNAPMAPEQPRVQERPGSSAPAPVARGVAGVLRRRGVAVGAGLGLVVAGGLGGFWVGHVTEDGQTAEVQLVDGGLPNGQVPGEGAPFGGPGRHGDTRVAPGADGDVDPQDPDGGGSSGTTSFVVPGRAGDDGRTTA